MRGNSLHGLIFALAALGLAACAVVPAASPDLRTELEALYDADQNHRLKLQATAMQSGSQSADFVALLRKQHTIDLANLKRLAQIVESSEWPKRSVVGDKAATAAFLIVQQADLPTQNHYLPLMQAAVALNEAAPENLALLEDRILMGEGKPQRYGGQLQAKASGGWELYPIEDPAQVHERRKAVGLPPLADYLRQFGERETP